MWRMGKHNIGLIRYRIVLDGLKLFLYMKGFGGCVCVCGWVNFVLLVFNMIRVVEPNANYCIKRGKFHLFGLMIGFECLECGILEVLILFMS